MYYMSACSQGIMARVVLADVAGHGEVVAAAADRLREAVRNHLDRWDQSALIRQLNDTFFKDMHGGPSATAFMASLYADSGKLLFTNAGHLPPLWFRASARSWNWMDSSAAVSTEILDLPLGMIEGTSYTQTATELDPGDLLLLYTDGISEALNQDGEELGLSRLKSIARGLPTHSPVAAGKALLAAVGQFRGSVAPGDDETVVALLRRAGP
jgi:sigma-B regulation protein RsbU (phosphoserine phosphatase)